MIDLKGKKAVVFGIANDRSIAYGIAKALYAAGVKLVIPYANQQMRKRVEPLAEEMNAITIECDVTKDYDVRRVFSLVKKEFGCLDMVVHSVAYANKEDLGGDFIQTSRNGFMTALDVSTYSLILIAREAQPYLNVGGSIITMTYYGAEKVVPNYNVMGVAKAALEATVRYLAPDLGQHGVRINALSAGPIKTLAAVGVSGFNSILKKMEKGSPLNKNVTLEDIAGTALYLLSDLSSGVTGDVVHVDTGLHIMAF